VKAEALRRPPLTRQGPSLAVQSSRATVFAFSWFSFLSRQNSRAIHGRLADAFVSSSEGGKISRTIFYGLYFPESGKTPPSRKRIFVNQMTISILNPPSARRHD
jgi:hypothetical protein